MQQTDHKGVFDVAFLNGCKWSFSNNDTPRCLLHCTIPITNNQFISHLTISSGASLVSRVISVFATDCTITLVVALAVFSNAFHSRFDLVHEKAGKLIRLWQQHSAQLLYPTLQVMSHDDGVDNIRLQLIYSVSQKWLWSSHTTGSQSLHTH